MESRMRRKSHVRFGERGGENRTEQSVNGVPAPTPRDPTPSEQDKLLTRDLVIAGQAMEIRVFDHLIIGDGRHFSFADEGLIEEYERQVIILSNQGRQAL